ncbi:MAG TPA: chemotaxis protein CheW, partial [Gemmatimonadaceae bacterium]
EITDDGGGIDVARVKQKAIEKGLLRPEQVERLSDREAVNLVFLPGFSTAREVTSISGRGVGMDVVKRNVESMRGRVEIASRTGQGTTFTIRLPLTLAITDGMLVRVGRERYLVPTSQIRLSFRPDRSQLSTVAGRGEVVMLRGEVMPVVRLHRLFGIHDAAENPADALLMLVGDGDHAAALLVDELLGKQQVVAKSLGDGLGRVPGVSGGAILGDGCVGLILDVPELVGIARRGTRAEMRPVA